MRVLALTALLFFSLKPLHCFGQAQLLFKGSAQAIGTCGGELLFVGKQPPVVYSGLYRTKRNSFALVRDYFDFGGSVDTPWSASKAIPSLNKPAPLLLRRGKSASSATLATTCGSVKSTKVVIPGYYPSLSDNFVVDNQDIIFSRNSRAATTLLRLSDGTVTPVARIEANNRPSVNGVIREPNVLRLSWGIVFTVGETSSGLNRLWILRDGATKLLTDFADLASQGYTNIEVGSFSKTGSEKLFFSVRAVAPNGQQESLLFYADENSVQRLPNLPQNMYYRGHLAISGLNGAIIDVTNLNPGAIQCGLLLLSFDDASYRDITSLFSGELQNSQVCLGNSAMAVIGSSIFFGDPINSASLMRLNLRTSERTQLLNATGLVRLFAVRGGRLYFNVSAPQGGDWFYVSDGTPEGTVPIKHRGRTLRGVEFEGAVEHKGSLFFPAYTRLRGENILDYGLYRFEPPVGPVAD